MGRLRTQIGIRRRTWFPPSPPKFIITGTGRCGTKFTATLLSEVGIPCGHENYFNPKYPKRYGLVGDASWLAVPYLPTYRGTVIHQVRDPLGVISSLAGTRFFSDEDTHGPFHSFACQHFAVTGDDLADAMRWYVEWNQRVEPHSSFRFRIEDISSELLRTLASEVGEPQPEPSAIEEALARVPSTLNSRKRRLLGWDNLPESPIKAELRRVATRYGYLP